MRRRSTFYWRSRHFLLGLLILILSTGIYFYIFNNSIIKDKKVIQPAHIILGNNKSFIKEFCTPLTTSNADIDILSTFPNFDFYPNWLWKKEFWNNFFEDRYKKDCDDNTRPPLKVIVVPHSHNDPGWLKTFEDYYEIKTKNIINNVITKLNEHKNMTFIWTEMVFLNTWWETAHPTKQKALKKLVEEGRLEITTGGWVMPDEATTNLYSLLDQFIEGHLWLNNTLGIKPSTGWAIDAFGHGPTVPYLLDQSGLEGAVIQRIHYAWKQWLAEKRLLNFKWLTGWSKDANPSMLVHSLPFDIYSIKSSCGPHPSVCLSFDFRLVPGEYLEQTAKHEDITDENVLDKAKTLMSEYSRIGSLTTHNVVLVPLGDDFRYEFGFEFDSQYLNYMKLFNFINNHKSLFNADVRFGTPSLYFEEIKKRESTFPSLKGDFFVYSDIYSDGKPAYWSGFFTTRPYYKILARQLENNLRSAEILYTLIANTLKVTKSPRDLSNAMENKIIDLYGNLIKARRNLGLFQHHDAITGTSKANVMADYGTKLFVSLIHCVRIQEIALSAIMLPSSNTKNVLQSDTEWENLGKYNEKLKIDLKKIRKLVLFNSLTHHNIQIASVKVDSTQVVVYDNRKEEYIPFQINPTKEALLGEKNNEQTYDLLFVADLPALTTVTFDLIPSKNTTSKATIFCSKCKTNGSVHEFSVNPLMADDISIENADIKLLFHHPSGFLTRILHKKDMQLNLCSIEFRAYNSAQHHSGAYLFKPNLDNMERDVLKDYSGNSQKDKIIIIKGTVVTELITLYPPFLIHTVRLFHVKNLTESIYLESIVDFEEPPKNRETELFMRIKTDILNSETPEFYTDQNGFQYEKRKKINKLGIEANFYPVTNMAWIQDDSSRLTLITAHAQAASSNTIGHLELMLDRRTLYDDYRGMGEGIVDNRRTVFKNWMLFETITDKSFTENESTFNKNAKYSLPSQHANYLSRILNYPANVYILDNNDPDSNVLRYHQFAKNFPDKLHLISLRTISDGVVEKLPTSTALMILQHQDFECSVGDNTKNLSQRNFKPNSSFVDLTVTSLFSVSLTSLYTFKRLKSLSEIEIPPMEIKTYKINF